MDAIVAVVSITAVTVIAILILSVPDDRRPFPPSFAT